jgi:hypothetical protein
MIFNGLMAMVTWGLKTIAWKNGRLERYVCEAKDEENFSFMWDLQMKSFNHKKSQWSPKV